MDPLISVVIATYNQAWCIRQTVASALAQSYPKIEVIVVDDASDDGTESILSSFDSRITYLRNARRTGRPAIVRNIGIEKSSGEYVAFLDGDDLWEPDKLAVQVSAALQYPDVGLIAVDGIHFRHDDGAILRSTLFSSWFALPPNSDTVRVNLYKFLLTHPYIQTPSQIMVPRWVLEKVGNFTPDLPPPEASDYDFQIKVAALGDFLIIRRSLTRWRYRPSNDSGPRELQHLHFAPANIAILRRHLASAENRYQPLIRYSIQNEFQSAIQRALDYGRAGNRVWASRYVIRLLTRHPTPSSAFAVGLALANLWHPHLVARLMNCLSQRSKTP